MLPLFSSATNAGSLESQPALADALRSLIQLRSAGWQLPPPQASHEVPAAAAATDTAAAVDAAAEALATQLGLSASASASASAASGSQPPPQLPPGFAPAQAAPPLAPPLAPPPLPLAAFADSWDYQAPEGAGVYGPFGLEQLSFWVQSGVMGADVQVGAGRQRGLGREEWVSAARVVSVGQLGQRLLTR